MEPKELLKMLMSRDGDNPHSLSSKLNQKTTQPQIYRFLENITKEPRRSTLQPLADYYKISVEAFYNSETAEKELKRLHLIPNKSSAQEPEDKNREVAESTEEPIQIHAEESINVKLLANGGSMGSGCDTLPDDVLVGQISLSPEWVRGRLRPSSVEALRFIHAYGDSMCPTFADGDVLLVDTGAIDPSRADGVYVLSTVARVFIKRVTSRFDGGFDVSSDNPAVKIISSLNGDHDVSVLGRVVWVWNGKRL